MSISLSFRFSPESTNAAAGTSRPSAAALSIQLVRRLANIQRRRAEQRMLRALERLDHPGLLADFHRASHG
jgi:hypothetical protein